MTLTQPWAGLVAADLKRIENRGRPIVKRADFGKPFALHASREIDGDVYARIKEIAPELLADDGAPTTTPLWERRWYRLSRITSAVIAIATIERVVVFDGGVVCDRHTDERIDLGDQRRWLFGPLGYVLHGIRALATPVPCSGNRGFWTLPPDIERAVVAQMGAVP